MSKPGSLSTSHSVDAWNQRVNGARASKPRPALVSVTLISHLFRHPGAQQASRGCTKTTRGFAPAHRAAPVGAGRPWRAARPWQGPGCPRALVGSAPLSCPQAGQDPRHAWGRLSCSFLRYWGAAGRFGVSCCGSGVENVWLQPWATFMIGCEISLGQGRSWNDNFSLSLNKA